MAIACILLSCCANCILCGAAAAAVALTLLILNRSDFIGIKIDLEPNR